MVLKCITQTIIPLKDVFSDRNVLPEEGFDDNHDRLVDDEVYNRI